MLYRSNHLSSFTEQSLITCDDKKGSCYWKNKDKYDMYEKVFLLWVELRKAAQKKIYLNFVFKAE